MTHKEQELNKKCAEILVECGYGKESPEGTKEYGFIRVKDSNWWNKSGYRSERVNPFTGDLESRKQVDAIEDYIGSNHRKLWVDSGLEKSCRSLVSRHQWRLDRIRWCIEQLENSNER